MRQSLKVYLDHRTIQLWGVNKNLLKNSERLMETTLKMAKDLNLTVVNQYMHKFEPHGLSLVLIIAQSHLAIHTWPEYSYMHIDIISCSKEADLTNLDVSLKMEFKPKKIAIKKIEY